MSDYQRDYALDRAILRDAAEPIAKPPVKLSSENGNAFVILGRCQRAARRAGWSREKWETFHARATASNYDALLRVVMEAFDVE